MMIHFIRPGWLLMLIPAMIFLVWVIYAYRQYNPWKNVCDLHLLPALLQPGSYSSMRLFNFVLFLFFSICIFALAGPSWRKAQLPVYRDISSLMLVLDLSPNMEIADLLPNRLMRAKYKIRDLINVAQNTQMGLVVFTEEAFTASPLSQDANTLNALLDELDAQMMPVSGSDSGQGLNEGYKLLKQAAVHGSILLITASEPTAISWAAAKSIAESGGHLNVWAMLENNAGNQETLTHLQQLAKAGNGSYYLFASDASDIQNILGTVKSRQVVKNDNVELWVDAGPWFCLLLVPVALLVLREYRRYEKN